MSETKFFEGPYKVSERPLNQTVPKAWALDIDAEKFFTAIATIWCAEEIPTKEEAATARLIAAAPEMYEILNQISIDGKYSVATIHELLNKINP